MLPQGEKWNMVANFLDKLCNESRTFGGGGIKVFLWRLRFPRNPLVLWCFCPSYNHWGITNSQFSCAVLSILVHNLCLRFLLPYAFRNPQTSRIFGNRKKVERKYINQSARWGAGISRSKWTFVLASGKSGIRRCRKNWQVHWRKKTYIVKCTEHAVNKYLKYKDG